MRSNAKASSAGSSMRRAKGLGRVVRGAFATPFASRGDSGSGASSRRAATALFAVACTFGLLTAPAGAALPTHPELPTLGQSGFERACGLAVDSAGNRYVADYETREIKVYSPSGTQITSFAASANTTEEGPCSLAVDSQGNVYVNGRNIDLVKYKPSSFPPTGSTTYEPDTSVHGTGVLVAEEANGVAVDPANDDVYVARPGRIASFEPDGTLISEAIGNEEAMGGFVSFVSVAVRGSTGKIYATSRAGTDKAYVLNPDGSKVLAEVDGSTTQAGSFTSLAYLGIAVDQSNGHFYVADIGGPSGHRVLDEFDAGGELVSELPTPSTLVGTNPSAVAVDNSGGANAGDVFVSAGQNPSSVFAFGPLVPPTHPELPALNLSGFERACGLAVDSAGNRYVADYETREIKVYSPSGTQITSFAASANTTEEGPCSLAVDSQGNVYVNGRNIDLVKYKPSSFPPTGSTTYEPDTSVHGTGVLVAEEANGVAVDPANDDVYVARPGRIASFEPDGTLISEAIGNEEAMGGFVSFVSVAVRGSTGKIYATSRAGTDKAYVLNPDGSKVLAEVDGSTTQAGSFTSLAYLGIAVDQSNGHFYVADIGGPSGHRVLDEFDAGGELVSELPTPSTLVGTNPSAVAVDNSGGANAGDVFVSAGQNPSSVFAFGPLTYTKFFKLEVSKTGAGQGTVTSAPAGVSCGSACKVDFEEGAEVILTATPATGSRFFSWKGCDSTAANQCTVTMSAARQVTVKFTAKPAIESESVTPGTTSAVLEAEVNPNGEETSYQFELLSEDAYQANGESFTGPEEPMKAPASPGSIEAGDEGVPVSAPVSGLTAHTAYRFRVVASNPAGEGEGKAIAFTTYLPPQVFEPCQNEAFRNGASSTLPDCRAYEQASAVDKNGDDLLGSIKMSRAAANGEAVSFQAPGPIPGAEGSQNFTPPFLASRGSTGWSTQGLFPPQSFGKVSLLLGWNPDFTHVFSWAKKLGSPTTMTFLDRSTATPGSVSQIIPYIPDPGQNLALPGSSDDGSVAFFEVWPEGGGGSTALRAGAAPGKPNLYVWDRETGVMRLAGVLNNGKAPVSGAFAGPYGWYRDQTTVGGAVTFGGAMYTRDEHAISADGSSVYFTAWGSGQLYRRLNPTKPQSEVVINEGKEECTQPELACTIHVSASQKDNGTGENGADSAGSKPAAFLGAAPDGSHAFFMSSEMLTNDANTGPVQPPASIGTVKPGPTEPEEEDPSLLFKHAIGLTTSPDGKYIYWADPSKGTIGRAKLDGANTPTEVNDEFIVPGETEFETHPKSEPEVITSAPSRPRYVAVSDEYVYWTNTGPLADYGIGAGPVEGAGTIGRAKLDSSGNLVSDSVEPEFITGATDPQGIAVNGSHIYWGNAEGEGFGEGLNGPRFQISRAEVNGKGVEPNFHAADFGLPIGMTLDGSYLYFGVHDSQAAGGKNGYLFRIPLEGGKAEGTYIGVSKIDSVALLGSYVYWTSNDGKSIGRRPLSSFDGAICEADPACEPKYLELEGTPVGVASDGERLYWSVNGEAPPNPGNDLYRYDAASGQLTDLAPDPEGNGAEVLGMLGASNDGSYVYFAANGVLADGAEQGSCPYPEGNGSCNLYLDHEGQISFVASVRSRGGGDGDDEDWRETANTSVDLGDQPKTARVSPDGRSLLFRSQEKLTAYDNEGTQQLYLYRDEATPQIVCVSCNPTGVPSGVPSLDSGLVESAGIRSIDSAAVQSRNLSADGKRVFFETRTLPLVVADTNGVADVYEWEAKGEGSCESEAQNGGCLYLISSGKGSEAATFIDASTSGNDVFFFTRERLVGQDVDSLVDVYDARAKAASPPSRHHHRRTSAKGKPAGTARPPRPKAARRRHRSSRAPATPSPSTRAKSRGSTSDTTSTSDTRRPTGGRSDEQVKDNPEAAPLPSRRPALPRRSAGAAKRRLGGGAEMVAVDLHLPTELLLGSRRQRGRRSRISGRCHQHWRCPHDHPLHDHHHAAR